MAVKYADSYIKLFSTMVIKPGKLSEIDTAVSLITKGKTAYQTIEKLRGCPWFFVGMIHYMEASCNFSKHLHNGDPLYSRTVNVPAGRPVVNPGRGAIAPSRTNPYSWFESALDAIDFMETKPAWKSVAGDWSLPAMLYRLEAFNGFGYRSSKINIPSPYLWSFSNHYVKGKYVADSVYDANAVSKQAGVAVIMYRVMEKQNLLARYIKTASGAATVLLIAATLFF